ncbi:MAG: M20 family metallopeptidase [Ancalomicrobiaceae bacterium]|nr:M20 family metallopeptidase [Ancalomicrobiaceae bacterium]
MPIINRVAELAEEACGWRRDFHRHPELQFAVHRTAARVAALLEEFSCDEVVTGVGGTGVVGIIRGRAPGSRVVGMRADMDALPIEEIRPSDHRSTVPGKMHACGHDGHTAMLLGAARYLAETRNFAGTAVVVFQPAEEAGAGGLAMVRDGLMERFGIEEIYGLHNMPGLPLGRFATRPGPIMASADSFELKLTGRGGHAAKPHMCVDPIVAGSQIVTALQSIVSRGTDPLDSTVVSVTRFQAGTLADNIIPQTALLGGTVRTLKPETREFAERRFRDIVEGIGRAMGVAVGLAFERGYPVVVNHAAQTEFAASVARDVSGIGEVLTDFDPTLIGEDFAYMLEARPGAFLFVGNGDSAGLHHPEYDFDDRLIPYGMSFWAKLIETAMPA